MSKAAGSIALSLVLILGMMLVPFNHASMSEQAQSFSKQYNQPRYVDVPSNEYEGYLIREVDGQASCGGATPEDADILNADPGVELKQISHVGDQITAQEEGLNIILRATAALDSNATAKQAFVTAASRWEALIANPITIIIDVDFGPSFFGGTTYNSSTIGGALGQIVGSTSNFPDVQSRLLAGASSTAETTLYTALPTGTVLTDLGPTAGVSSSSAVFRALGSLAAVADTTTETTIGVPPRIGFNSAFGFDFNPDDGIDADKMDFDAVAAHEIGHVLGFTSRVGSTGALSVSILDIFRFRPGMSLGTFPTATRIISPGGTQVFFAGGPEFGLSTARSDFSGGDGQQASHWKDDAQSGTHVGIMDPTIPRGAREVITNNDLAAYDAFGYRLMGSAPPPEDDAVVLTSGVARMGSISAPPPESGVLGGTQYSIQVPAGTTQLKLDLNGNQDVDLLVRFGAKIVIQDGEPVVDHDSSSTGNVESITITSASNPPLRQGTYFIAIGNFGPGAADYTVTAALTTGGGGGQGTAPAINSVAASLSGDVLRFTGTVSDPDGDIVQGQSTLLNGAGQVVADSGPFAVDFGTSTSVTFNVNIPGTNLFPSAVKATLLFIDGQGNRSPAMTADFSQPDPGGPEIKNVTVSGSKITIKGKNLIGPLTLEINGVDVATKDNSGTKKAKFGGVASSLRSGDNRVRIRNGTLRSNIFVFTM